LYDGQRYNHGARFITTRRMSDISPDGQPFLLMKPEAGSAASARPQIMVVQNWFEELKRLVPVN
jgi:hypothetical protein